MRVARPARVARVARVALRSVWCAALAGLALAPVMARACTLPAEAGRRLHHDGLQLAWRTEPAVLSVGQPFRLWIQACPTELQLRRVDATMPEHRHGMNYRPSIVAEGPGRWRVDGLLWHMAGRWEWRFEAELRGERHDLRQSVELR